MSKDLHVPEQLHSGSLTGLILFRRRGRYAGRIQEEYLGRAARGLVSSKTLGLNKG